MVIDSTGPLAAAKPDARLIKLLLRARQFNATLAEGVPFAALVQRGRCQPVLLHATRPPQLSRTGYHPGDPRGAAAARFDDREAARALTFAACLARSTDRARLWLSPIRIQKDVPTRPATISSSSCCSAGRSPAHRSGCIRDKIRGMSPTSSPAVRYWNMARQRYHRLSARCSRAPRVSADPGRSSGPGQPRKTAASRPRKANSRERQVRT